MSNTFTMLIKFESVRSRFVRRYVGHIFYLAIVVILIPAFFYFELCVVLPAVVEDWSEQIVHIMCATFLLLNIIGNFMYGMFTNTSIKGKLLNAINKNNWTLCVICETLRPPRSWHCEICNICILKRDHHCTFLACCVGYFNHRYFLLFTFDIFISMLYALYYNIKFISQFITWNHGLIIVKFVFPLASFVIDFGYESMYIFLVVVNILVAAFSGFLFFYHMNNILKGRVTPENKIHTLNFLYDKGWRNNLIEVFGYRWYFTWMLPFIQSELPGNGIDWSMDDKYK